MSDPISFHETVDPAPVKVDGDAVEVKPQPKKKATPKPADKAGYKPFNWP